MDARVPLVMFRHTEISGSLHAEQLLTFDLMCRISFSFCVRRTRGYPSSSTNLTRPGSACDVNVTTLNLNKVCGFMQKQEFHISARCRETEQVQGVSVNYCPFWLNDTR